MSDAELIRYLDGELTGDETGLLLERLRAEPAAAARLEELQIRSWRLTALLPHTDPSDLETRRSADEIRRTIIAPRARRSAWSDSPLLRAAAVIFVLLAGALAAPPARAWIAQQLRAAADAILPGSAPAPEAPAAPEAAGSALSIAFPVAGESFEIRVPAAGGILVVRTSDRADGAIEVTGATIADHVVLPQGLRLEGVGAADARYVLDLPSRVTTLRLRIGDAPAVTHDVGGSDRREIRLSESPLPTN